MIRAREARQRVEKFFENSMIAFGRYLENQRRGEILNNAISKRAREGYSSHSFQAPCCYHAAIRPYFEGLGYRVVVTPNITDDTLIDIDIFW